MNNGVGGNLKVHTMTLYQPKPWRTSAILSRFAPKLGNGVESLPHRGKTEKLRRGAENLGSFDHFLGFDFLTVSTTVVAGRLLASFSVIN